MRGDVPLQKAKLEGGAARVETGVLQVGDDWPGTFIRGDDSLMFSLAVRQAHAVIARDPALKAQYWLLLSQLKGIGEILKLCRVNGEESG